MSVKSIKVQQFERYINNEKELEDWSRYISKDDIINIQYLSNNHTIVVFYWSED